MDYALSEALKLTNASDSKRVLFVYDVNCQYSKHLFKRMREGEHLSLDENLVFVFGIGLFHVHGHQESCVPRYSLTFIRGAGVNSGEILESLWAVVNEVARATSTMTAAHRSEVLDAIFADINWKKMLNLIRNISKNWSNARSQLRIAQEDFELLNETASTQQRLDWQGQLDEAHRRREEDGDVSAMDVLSPKFIKPPTLAKVRTTLMDGEKRLGSDVGITSWLALGLKIQESQIRLRSFIRTFPKERTDQQELEIAKRRESVYRDIDEFYEIAATLFPDAALDSLKCDEPPRPRVELEDDESSDDDLDQENPWSLAQNETEDVQIPLPSSLSESAFTPALKRAKEKELQLRIAQADDALESIRTEIGHKSFLFRSNIRLAQGKKQKTRGYAAVNAVNRNLRDYVRVYNLARWAMHRLGADPSTKLRYRPVNKEDMKAVTTIYNPGARGQRNSPLSWIWTLNVSRDSDRSEYLEELYRVNWLRAKSRVERWEEEFTLLECEMDWVLRFFGYREAECRSWVDYRPESPGHVAYAKRQAHMWRLLHVRAEKVFRETKEKGAGRVTSM